MVVDDDSFFRRLTFDVAIGPEAGNRAFFGRNALDGLVDGITAFVEGREPRWRHRSYRVGAPALLGCSPWLNDKALLDVIARLPSACVVMTKQERSPRVAASLQRLRVLNEATPGIELRALTQLGDRAPKVDGKPLVVGPWTTVDPEITIPTIRAIGYRRTGASYVPLAHAKLALLGHICWTDEDPVGGVGDYVWFRGERLWVSSANFTFSSRRSIEFGYWTEQSDLIDAVKHFLVELIGSSEDLDAGADLPDPELVEVEYDEAAIAEAYGQLEEAEPWEDDASDEDSH